MDTAMLKIMLSAWNVLSKIQRARSTLHKQLQILIFKMQNNLSTESGGGQSWLESLSQIMRTEYSLDEIFLTIGLEAHLTT